eukprot:TRINITY_DN21297_c0_g1_i1.p1 TRINITY_DN21297_c0_g1~~TRINITY_DN21297_c0_g1_i1.p1  ORF type:complete len:380 (+),score=148.91 TRINITY_DN21297_c0_g1_i1:79-1140(+)
MALLGLDTPVKKGIFAAYLGLWCLLRLCIFASQRGGDAAPPYAPAALLIATTLLKIAISFAMFLRSTQGRVREIWAQLVASRRAFLLYLFPAAAYVVYDNLMFFCLKQMDPVTYVILMQFRLPTTALIWQAVFGKSITPPQWCGLVLVTAACVLQRWHYVSANEGAAQEGSLFLGLAACVAQIACGVFSSVYNEFLLKKGVVSIDVQNIYLYSHSLVCNVVYLIASGQADYLNVFSTESRPRSMGWFMSIATLLAVIGIVTALFLQHLDSVRKSVASALELFADAYLAYLFFAIPVTQRTFAACCLCSLGIYLYSKMHNDDDETKAPESPTFGPKLSSILVDRGTRRDSDSDA